MKVNLEIDNDSLSDIVVNSLKSDYGYVVTHGDQELLDALKKVVEYYSTESEYIEWMDSLGITVEKVCCDGGGPVGPGCLHDHCSGPKLVERK